MKSGGSTYHIGIPVPVRPVTGISATASNRLVYHSLVGRCDWLYQGGGLDMESEFSFPVKPTFSAARGEGWAAARPLHQGEMVLRVAALAAVPRDACADRVCAGCFRCECQLRHALVQVLHAPYPDCECLPACAQCASPGCFQLLDLPPDTYNVSDPSLMPKTQPCTSSCLLCPC